MPASGTGQRGGSRTTRHGGQSWQAWGPGLVRAGCGHDLVGGHHVNEWPTGWVRPNKGLDPGNGQGAPGGNNGPGAGDQAGAPRGAGISNDPTVRLPYGAGGSDGAG